MMNKDKYIPQGYKPSPLGPIPEDWEVKRLGEIAEIGSGGTPSKSHSEYWNGNIPWVTTSLLNNPYIEIAEEYITEEGLNNSSAKMLNKGVLLMAMYGQGQTRGKVSKLLISASTNQACAYIDVHTGLVDYIHQNLIANYESIRNESNDGNQKNLSLGIISNIRISFPPFPEQHRIVSVLSLWDTAISKQTALIEKLTLRKRGLMQQLLTGKKRLKEFGGEWERIKAGEIFKSISVKGNGPEVLLSATQEHGVIPRDKLESRVTMPTGDTNSFKLVEVGDFVISLRSFQGGLEYSEHRGIVSPAYTVLKPIVEIDKSFYRYYFKSAEFIGHLAIAVIGIRDGKQISYEDFCFVKIPYPNIKEQKAISSVLLQADKEIELANKKLAATQEQKKGLMQVLLTGKKRVK